MDLTYGAYLGLPELLALQHSRSDPQDHDEMLFIIIHQVYELWFKLLLHEFDEIIDRMTAGDLYGSLATWKRVRTVMKTLVGQLDILETMTPMRFTAFRDRLESASGFQSAQFRELEFQLGYKRPELMAWHPEGSPERAALEQRLAAPSVADALDAFLRHQGADPARRADELLRLYRDRPDLVILFESMTDFDEGLQEWRYRHVKMVERTIGNKRGTGGSPGAAYLRETLFNPLFPDLWSIRHAL